MSHGPGRREAVARQGTYRARHPRGMRRRQFLAAASVALDGDVEHRDGAAGYETAMVTVTADWTVSVVAT